MSTFETILPSNSTPLERDIEKATAFPDLPIDALASLVDARKIDARLLPWLAYRFAADIWDDNWSEGKKREVVAQQFDLHRLKGTKEGISRMLGVVDATLLDSVSFPQRVFATAGISKEQRNAWLARMPEIRVYFAATTGTAGPDAFARGLGAFVGHGFARFDAAAAIYGRRAVVRYPDGKEISLRRSTVETVVETRQSVDVDRLHIPGEAASALFAGGFLGGAFVTKRNKQASIITYTLNRTYDSSASELHLDTVAPGLDPIDVKYERYADQLPRGPGLFVGDFLRRHYVLTDDAANHIYDRVFLHDPTVDAPWTKAHSFVNHARLGIARFHAELLVDAKSKTRPRAGFAGLAYCGRAFATNENLSRTKLAYAAVRRSKALRDRVKVDTQTTRTVTFGDGFKFGDGIKFGSKVRNRLR
ncbi:phage tail protein I [Rhizobium sp. 1AS11]|uniref:phage tail protein I n=1 Tax=Rhizobium acaciae TaxID=2989736 RepID=UPI0022221E41|nr:phage tail protein I [Rhizobium acaciae]MCW1412211.1 phage tail protein I [Rhizobium acaciae]MCW1744226.1 phage tail protein I [Rhizobium acaciae]